MTIEPNTLVADIDPTVLPDSADKIVQLPGSRPGDVLSLSQEKVVATHVKENFAPTMTWADAVAQLRSKYVRGAQRDFNIVDGIITDIRRAKFGEPLTVDQGRVQEQIIAALAGTKPHWEPGIAQRIAASGQAVREVVMLQFVTATTRGDFDAALKRFTAIFGDVPRRSPGEPLTGDDGGVEDVEGAF